jgi:hypothetical protein
MNIQKRFKNLFNLSGLLSMIACTGRFCMFFFFWVFLDISAIAFLLAYVPAGASKKQYK